MADMTGTTVYPERVNEYLILAPNWILPRSQSERTMMYSARDNRVYVNVERRGAKEWVPLAQASNVKVASLKLAIHMTIGELSKRLISMCNQVPTSSPPTIDQSTMNLIQELYDEVDDVKRSQLKSTYADNPFFANRCNCCDSYMEKKHSCIHSDCPGMCSECHAHSIGSGTDKCPSCNKEQVIDCPVCCETKKVGECLLGTKCSHGVCLSCFAEAYRCRRPIDKCPLCRTDFH